MLIEMFGAPTSGKTTLVKELRKFGIAVSHPNEDDKIPDSSMEFAVKLAKLYGDVNAFHDIDKLDQVAYKTQAAIGAAHRGRADKYPIVFDELVAQYGMSFAIRVSSDWSWYFEEMPLPDLLVVLRAHKSVLIKRTIERGKLTRVDKTGICVDLIKPMLAILRKRNCPMIELNTNLANKIECTRRIIYKIHEVYGLMEKRK